jgi:FAD/FMN-containing dehydrogenase
MKKLFAACLLSTALLVGCSGEEETADTEACEHLQNGPQSAVTATAAAAGAPAVSNDHKRYDITLVDVTGGKGGSVSFASSEAAEYVFFLNADVPFKATDASGQTVAIEASATSSSECGDIKGRHIVPLGVGTYTLSFGPTSATSVSLVIEEEAHEEHSHEH